MNESRKRGGETKTNMEEGFVGLSASVGMAFPLRKARAGERRRRWDEKKLASDDLATREKNHARKEMSRVMKVELARMTRLSMHPTRAGGVSQIHLSTY